MYNVNNVKSSVINMIRVYRARAYVRLRDTPTTRRIHTNPPTSRGSHLILGIETSFDETGVAVVNEYGDILGESLKSTYIDRRLNAQFGGVVPSLAAAEHKAHIDRCIFDALQRASIVDPSRELDAIGVTVGPGLAPCLRVGCDAAANFSREYNLPLIKVNHMAAHALTPRMQLKRPPAPFSFSSTQANNASEEARPWRPLEFPFLTLLVSGGHTQLVLVRSVLDFQILGNTLDDALGEALDKTARLLTLGKRHVSLTSQRDTLEVHATSGGEVIERMAREVSGEVQRCGGHNLPQLPIPMRRKANTRKAAAKSNGNIADENLFSFSFAGLKTAALYKLQDEQGEDYIAATRHIFQNQMNNNNNNNNNNNRSSGGGGGDGGGSDNGSDYRNVNVNDNAPLARALRVARVHDARALAMAAAFQSAAFAHIEDRVRQALCHVSTHEPPIRDLVVSGGVAANAALAARLRPLEEEFDALRVHFPSPALARDNGAMIAWCAMEHWRCRSPASPLIRVPMRENERLRFAPRWRIDQQSDDDV